MNLGVGDVLRGGTRGFLWGGYWLIGGIGEF